MSRGRVYQYLLDVRDSDGKLRVFSVTQSGGETRVVGNWATHVVHEAAGSVESEIELVFGVEVIGRHVANRS